MTSLVSYLIITRDRPTELGTALASIAQQTYTPSEVIVVDNASAEPAEPVASRFDRPGRPVRYHRSQENLGVSGGRNVALRLARGDILITLDDDAAFADPDAARRVVERFQRDQGIGALSFRIVAPSGEMRPKEFPTYDKSLNPDAEFDTTYFCGGAVAVRRVVHEAVGLFVEHFFFGLEDLELSLRMLDAGFRIVYFPSVTVVHQKAAASRLSREDVVSQELQNRFEMNVRNLPWTYVLSQQIIRMGHALVLLRGNPVPLVRHVLWCARSLPRLLPQRRCIRPDTIRRIRQAHGRLLY